MTWNPRSFIVCPFYKLELFRTLSEMRLFHIILKDFIDSPQLRSMCRDEEM